LNKPLEKILIITYYWPPSGGAGVQRWVKFSKYLKNFGYQPLVITVRAEKASYALLDDSLEKEVEEVEVVRTNTFEPFQMYKKLLGKKEIPYAGFANETKPGALEKLSRFVRGNFFVPDARKGWNRFVLPVARRLIRKYDIKNLVTTSPPHSTQLTGLKLKEEFNLNWIADLRDPWTDIYYYDMMYHTPWAVRYDKKLEHRVLSRADKVVVVSHAMKELFAGKLVQGEKDKIRVIPNGYDEKDFAGIPKTGNRQFTITYTGTIAGSYHIDNFLKALAQLDTNHFILRFVGQVSEKYKEFIRSLGLESKTQFIGHVPHSAAIRYMVNSDLLLLAVPDVPDNLGILTGKLFEYLASGTFILGVGPAQGDAARIVQACKAGKMFDYQDTAGMLHYLKEKFRAWKPETKNNKVNPCRQYSRQALTAEMAKLFIAG